MPREEVFYLQPLIPPKRFDIPPPLTGGCSEGLGARVVWFFFKRIVNSPITEHDEGVSTCTTEMYSSTLFAQNPSFEIVH